MDVTFRIMNKGDLPFFKMLIQHSPAWEASECSCDNLEKYIQDYEKIKGTWLVWSKNNEKIAISYSVESAPSNQKPWIGTLLVEPTWRLKGYGKGIILHLCKVFQKNNHKVVYSAVSVQQNDWIYFLSSCGFEQFKIEKAENETYLLFLKTLTRLS